MPPLIAAAAAAWAAVSAAVAAISITTVVVNIAISVGLSLLSSLLIGGGKKPSVHASRENFRNPLAPRVKAYGRVKLGGAIVLMKLGPIQWYGNTVNALYIAVAQAQGLFDMQEEIWLGDAKAVMDGDIVVQPTNYAYHDGDWVRIETRRGTTTQDAMSMLTGGLPGAWTSDFQGKGVPYIAARLVGPAIQDFSKVFPAGLPALSTVARTSQVWDPRDNTQHPNIPSGWKYTANGILCVLNAVRDADGLGLPVDMAIAGIDVWMLEADYCDIWRLTKNGGSEPMYRLAGAYQMTDAPKAWLPKMLDPMDARIALRADGAIVPSVGRWREPELTISDDQVISYTGFARGKAKGEIKNRIDATFVSPDYDYIQQQADALLNEDSIDVDGEQAVTLDLDWCPSHPQCRVRQKIEYGRQDPERWNGTIVSKVYGIKFLTPNSDGSPKRLVHFQIAELGADTSFEVLRFAFDVKTGNCTFQVSEMTAADFEFDPEVDEGDAPEFPRSAAANQVENPHGLVISVSGTAITATIDAPLDSSLDKLLDYRVTADNLSDDEASWTSITVSGDSGTTGSLPNGRYDVRARLRDSSGSPDLYSDTRAIRGVPIGTFIPSQITTPPSTFTVTDCGGATVQLHAAAVADIRSRGVRVWYASGFSSTFASATLLAEYDLQAGASVTDFQALPASGNYNFWITTIAITGADTPPSSAVAVTVSGGSFADPAPVPSVPANLIVTPNSSTISLAWDANPTIDSVTGYQVWYSPDQVGFGGATLVASPLGHSALITGLTPATGYSIYIVAVNVHGSSAPTTVAFVTTLALSEYRAVTAHASPLQLLDTDTWVAITNATGAALEVRLPAYPIVGQGMLLTDAGGAGADAGSLNWTVKNAAGSTTVDSVATIGGWSSEGWTGSAWVLGKTA